MRVDSTARGWRCPDATCTIARVDPLRIAFFGTGGDFSLPSLRVLTREQRVVAIVSARDRRVPAWRRLLRRLTHADTLATFAREHRIPMAEVSARDDARATRLLQRTRPDLICIAGHRWILPPAVLALAPLGGVNLHASLLPRHRGMLPLFWIYYHDDRETGVTVHVATEAADAGDILGQASFPLPRGLSAGDLNRRNGECGATVLAECVRRLATGTAERRAQDAALATPAPLVRPGTPMVRFDAWDVERVWHFLAGLHPWFQEPLRLADGRGARYTGVASYARTAQRATPGTVLPVPGGLELHCHGGVVRLDIGRVPRRLPG